MLEIVVKGQKYTLEEARQIYEELRPLFEQQPFTVPIYPPPAYPDPYAPIYPDPYYSPITWEPIVTCMMSESKSVAIVEA